MQEPGYMRAPGLRTIPHPYTKTATQVFATAMFGLRLALCLFENTNNDVTTTTSTVSNPLLHVRPWRAGGIAYCSTRSKSMSSSASHRVLGRGRRVVVKSSFSSLYELMRHIIAPAPHACLWTWLKDPQCTIYLLQPLTFTPLQTKIYIFLS